MIWKTNDKKNLQAFWRVLDRFQNTIWVKKWINLARKNTRLQWLAEDTSKTWEERSSVFSEKIAVL